MSGSTSRKKSSDATKAEDSFLINLKNALDSPDVRKLVQEVLVGTVGDLLTTQLDDVRQDLRQIKDSSSHTNDLVITLQESVTKIDERLVKVEHMVPQFDTTANKAVQMAETAQQAINELRSKMSEMESVITKSQSPLDMDDLAEMVQRAPNIMVVNIPPELKASNDITKFFVDTTNKHTNLDISPPDVASVQRVGHFVRVSFVNTGTRNKVFAARRFFGHAQPGNTNKPLYLREDLTPKQQRHFHKMRPVFQHLKATSVAGQRSPFYKAGVLFHYPATGAPAVAHPANFDDTLLAQIAAQVPAPSQAAA